MISSGSTYTTAINVSGPMAPSWFNMTIFLAPLALWAAGAAVFLAAGAVIEPGIGGEIVAKTMEGVCDGSGGWLCGATAEEAAKNAAKQAGQKRFGIL